VSAMHGVNGISNDKRKDKNYGNQKIFGAAYT
jgi:hypothetical protein